MIHFRCVLGGTAPLTVGEEKTAGARRGKKNKRKTNITLRTRRLDGDGKKDVLTRYFAVGGVVASAGLQISDVRPRVAPVVGYGQSQHVSRRGVTPATAPATAPATGVQNDDVREGDESGSDVEENSLIVSIKRVAQFKLTKLVRGPKHKMEPPGRKAMVELSAEGPVVRWCESVTKFPTRSPEVSRLNRLYNASTSAYEVMA